MTQPLTRDIFDAPPSTHVPMLTILVPLGAASAVSAIEEIAKQLPEVPHEVIGLYSDESAARAIEASGRPATLRLLRVPEGFGAALAAGARLAAGDVVVWVEPGEGAALTDVAGMAELLRQEHGAMVIASEPTGTRRTGVLNFLLAACAGLPVWNSLAGRRVYAAAFLERRAKPAANRVAAELEMLVAAQLEHVHVGVFRGTVAGRRAEMPRGDKDFAAALRQALQAPVLVWGLWLLMSLAAVISLLVRHISIGDSANGVLPAAGVFALTLAVRRSRGRTRIADAFFSLVLLNPFFYAGASGPFDKTLLSAGLLALMAGAIVAMKRDALRRYVAVAVLALVLAAVADVFVMLLPALVTWLLLAGYTQARSKNSRQWLRGFIVMAAAEADLIVFCLACILVEPTVSPTRITLFASIVSFSEFPLLVIAIVALALGWRPARPRAAKGQDVSREERAAVAMSAPPHFAGMLALLLGLLTMLLNNFQAGVLPPPGADQTALILCLLYTVFALHGPRRFQWVAPPLLLAAAASYLASRWM